MPDSRHASSIPDHHRPWLYGMFLLSGIAALVFEVLWFRMSAFSFGSSLWAATAVLSAYMAGQALGNGLAAMFAERVKHPLKLYARAEISIGLSGIALIYLLPNVGSWLGATSRELLTQDASLTLQVWRFFIAFCLMLFPATLMGLTLPLLVQTLRARTEKGSVIGRLYGWNIAGAVSGVLLTEWLLLSRLGVTGSAVLASLLCLLAATIAFRLNRPAPGLPVEKSVLSLKVAIAAALTGAILLGLEVLWFRLLLLQLRGTDSSFAYMLAMVLTGLSIGSLCAGAWLNRQSATPGKVSGLALMSACLVPLSYLALMLPAPTWLKAVLLIFPVALLSGALLPLITACLLAQTQRPAASTGWVWLTNTSGAALGAAGTGLWLLPALGMERSLLLLGVGYVVVALCLLPRGKWYGNSLLAAVVILGYVLFPTGWIDHSLQAARSPYVQMDGSRLIATREGLNETVQLLERRKYGQPYSYRLVTDGYSMSGTERDSQRYMRLFAWLPQSFHPLPESALLISYGVGTTADALLQDQRLKQLQIVDLSADVLAMSPLIHGRHDPLNDPRVSVMVEDGRQYLRLTDRQFDVITAEPPPPRMKGVVNLYTREYFQLIHQRLKPDGISSYWLPVDQLTTASSQAIVNAFCQVFSDCSLWSGSNYNWILLGRKSTDPISTVGLDGLWEKATNTQLSDLGLEQPAMLGSTFLADARQLADWADDTAPLTDNWPKRLSEKPASHEDIQGYAGWADALEASKRFATSVWAQENFPPEYRAQALNYYEIQPLLNNEIRPAPNLNLPLVHHLLTTTTLRTPVYWLLDSDLTEQRIIDAQLDAGYKPDFAYALGVRALVTGDFKTASSLLQEAFNAGDTRAAGPAVYSLCRQGELMTARRLAESAPETLSFRCWP